MDTRAHASTRAGGFAILRNGMHWVFSGPGSRSSGSCSGRGANDSSLLSLASTASGGYRVSCHMEMIVVEEDKRRQKE